MPAPPGGWPRGRFSFRSGRPAGWLGRRKGLDGVCGRLISRVPAAWSARMRSSLTVDVSWSALTLLVRRDFSAPAALKSLSVSIWLPSAPRTTTSVSLKSKLPLPSVSHWVVFDSPLALVVTTVLSRSEPFESKSLTVRVVPPSAARVVRSVWERS